MLPNNRRKICIPGAANFDACRCCLSPCKSLCVPCHNFGLSASRCPQRNYCQLELAVRLMVKEGLHNNQMRREKWFPPAVFETTTTTLYPLRKLVSVKDKPLDETLIARQKTRGGLMYNLPLFPFCGTLIGATDQATQITHICVRKNLCNMNKQATLMVMLCILRIED